MTKRLGWDPSASSTRATPPNPLVMATRREKETLCSVITEDGPCPEFTAYVDTYRETPLCIIHARAINDLPDSIAKRQATIEMAVSTLTNMSVEAISVIGQIMNDEDAPTAVRLKAATEVLDRTGIVKTQTLNITANDEPLHEATSADLIRDRLSKLAVNAQNVIPFERSDSDETDSLGEESTEGH